MARASMRWILENPNITCIIPGFKNVKQIEDNLATLEVPAFTSEEQTRLHSFYSTQVHEHIRGAY
ncbi:Aldo/keto reductase family protein [compost metagenome]